MLAALIATLALAALTSAVPMKRALAQVITSCNVPDTVALTFDDGPYEYLQIISDALTAAGATGTFFFNGNNYDCIYNPESAARVQYAVAAGHQIASHTWSHPHLNSLSADQVDAEFSRINTALEKIAGVLPAFIRPPYGEYNDQVLEIAAKYGQAIVTWDFDSGDSTGSTAVQSNHAYDEAIANHPSNLLTLNHETYESTANDVVPHAVKTLQGAGYKLVSLAECLGAQPYLSQTSAQSTRDASWTCN